MQSPLTFSPDSLTKRGARTGSATADALSLPAVNDGVSRARQMNDEHSVGLTDPRIIQILNQSKEGRAKLQGWKEREARMNDPPPIQNVPTFSLRNIINALVFFVSIAGLLTLLMIGIIEVVRWFF